MRQTLEQVQFFTFSNEGDGETEYAGIHQTLYAQATVVCPIPLCTTLINPSPLDVGMIPFDEDVYQLIEVVDPHSEGVCEECVVQVSLASRLVPDILAKAKVFVHNNWPGLEVLPEHRAVV